MTYAEIDTSTDAGAPYELFEFVEGVRAWRYTTSPSADTWGGQQWLPRPIMREAVVRDSTSIGDPLVVTLPDNDPLALELLAGMSVHLVTVKIRQLHRGDLDAQARVLFTGMVSGVSFQGAEAKISCGSRYALTSKRRIAPTTYQAACNLTWGSLRCGVNPETYRINPTATASDQVGRTLTLASLAGYPDGHFNGGEVALGGARRFIERHEKLDNPLIFESAGRLTLSYPFGGLTTTPAAILVYPNCQKTEADCTGRYNNLVNYLGWTRLPSVNPYNRSAFYLREADAVAPPAGSSGDLPSDPSTPGAPVLSGYQIVLAPVTQYYELVDATSSAWRTWWTFRFVSTGYLFVNRQITPYDNDYVMQESDTAAAGMWASPRPTPDFGDVEVRVDAVLQGPQSSIVGSLRHAQWFDPHEFNTCAIRVLSLEQWFEAKPNVVATVRFRNKTTGLVLAQGDITLDITVPFVDQPGIGA